MIAMDVPTIDVAGIASDIDVIEWEREARLNHSSVLNSASSAMRALSSDDETHRRLAVLSFRYRWPIDDVTFRQIAQVAIGDKSLELRLIALSLLYVSFIRCETSNARRTIAESIRYVAESPDQSDEIAAAARDYQAIIADRVKFSKSPFKDV